MNKIVKKIGNVVGFVLLYVGFGSLIVLCCGHFLFGHPIDESTVIQSLGSGIGLAIGRILVTGAETVYHTICKKIRDYKLRKEY